MLVWRGKEVFDRVMLASEEAGNSILADCVVEAKGTVLVKTTALQGSIQMRPMQMIASNVLAGYFGSWDINYAICVEEGTDPHVILPRFKKALFWKGLDHPVPMVWHPGTRARPYLVPAADKYFPLFAGRISARLAFG